MTHERTAQFLFVKIEWTAIKQQTARNGRQWRGGFLFPPIFPLHFSGSYLAHRANNNNNNTDPKLYTPDSFNDVERSRRHWVFPSTLPLLPHEGANTTQLYASQNVVVFFLFSWLVRRRRLYFSPCDDVPLWMPWARALKKLPVLCSTLRLSQWSL